MLWCYSFVPSSVRARIFCSGTDQTFSLSFVIHHLVYLLFMYILQRTSVVSWHLSEEQNNNLLLSNACPPALFVGWVEPAVRTQSTLLKE